MEHPRYSLDIVASKFLSKPPSWDELFHPPNNLAVSPGTKQYEIKPYDFRHTNTEISPLLTNIHSSINCIRRRNNVVSFIASYLPCMLSTRSTSTSQPAGTALLFFYNTCIQCTMRCYVHSHWQFRHLQITCLGMITLYNTARWTTKAPLPITCSQTTLYKSALHYEAQWEMLN